MAPPPQVEEPEEVAKEHQAEVAAVVAVATVAAAAAAAARGRGSIRVPAMPEETAASWEVVMGEGPGVVRAAAVAMATEAAAAKVVEMAAEDW